MSEPPRLKRQRSNIVGDQSGQGTCYAHASSKVHRKNITRRKLQR